MNTFTQDQVVARLRAIVKTRGTQSRLADEIGVSRSFLNEVVKGTRPPTGKILDFLGIQSQTIYIHKGENS
jgi:transcriptional regulator with XRE-family HTH domain